MKDYSVNFKPNYIYDLSRFNQAVEGVKSVVTVGLAGAGDVASSLVGRWKEVSR